MQYVATREITVAWNACPPATFVTGSCLNSTDWRRTDLYNIKMTISRRRASTVYSRLNFTIIDVIDLSDSSPVDYTPDDFFSFYEVIFNIDLNVTDYTSIQFTFLGSIVGFLLSSQDQQIDNGIGTRQLRLQEFLATPLVIFNNAWIQDLTTDMGKSLSLAVPSYRVCPQTELFSNI
jgi:hypothetical protein